MTAGPWTGTAANGQNPASSFFGNWQQGNPTRPLFHEAAGPDLRAKGFQNRKPTFDPVLLVTNPREALTIPPTGPNSNGPCSSPTPVPRIHPRSTNFTSANGRPLLEFCAPVVRGPKMAGTVPQSCSCTSAT